MATKKFGIANYTGKTDGCDSPTLYTTEIQGILDEIYKTIYDGRDRVISGLMEIYSSASSDGLDHLKEFSAKEAELKKVHKDKDKLLDLMMEGLINKQDFKRRNDMLNADLERIESQISAINNDIKLQEQGKTRLQGLKKAMEAEFAKSNGFGAELNKILLDKIVVHKTDGNKRHVKLEICLNLGGTYLAELGLDKNNIISLEQIGISQAQVSRLEKNALKNMKKYIS